MSRVGKLTINIPENVTIEVKEGGRFGYKEVVVNGPKGTLSQSFRNGVDFKSEGNEFNVVRENELKANRSLHGLYRTLVQNMVDGVVEGFSKQLEIVGIGYRADLQGTNLVLSLGYSHKITYAPPQGINIKVDEQTKITVEGADKQMVGEVTAKIRAFRKPEPYKGKGIRYLGEKVKKKSTKSTK